jgi:hypothetical protein
VLTVELERMEVKFATAGEASPTDLDLYQRTAANMRRLLEAVGLERRQKTVGPTTLSEYLESLQAENQAEAGAAEVNEDGEDA